jgi:cation:H+ antiporter
LEYLIPQEWFIGQPQWLLLMVTAVAVVALAKGADWLVDGASGLAYRLGIPTVIVGATIVSLGTTSPEAAVSVMAAWSGEPGLALGNAVGSIIVDSGLIFGLGCLMVVLPADRFVLSRQGWVQFGAGVGLAAICYGLWIFQGDDAVIGRTVGVAMIALLVVYMVVSVRWAGQHPRGEPFQDEAAQVAQKANVPAIRLVTIGIAGLALVLFGSRGMIASVTELAEAHWHVPKVVIAATLVAFGTSLPELVIGMASIMKGHREILVGNIIGADILNVLFVVGASALAAPLPIIEHGTRIPEILLYLHLPTMLLVLVMFRLFIAASTRRGTFRRWYGLPLIALYLAYAIAQYVVS